MTLPIRTCLLLSAYLLGTWEVPGWVLFGTKRAHVSRAYLCHLVIGGRLFANEDLRIVEALLTAWDHESMGSTKPKRR